MANIGLFRGSFDPVHVGHTNTAISAYHALNLDAVWLMPRQNYSYKPNLTPILKRIEMCELACKNLDGISVSDFESKLEYSLSLNVLLNEIKQSYPNDNFTLIMGTDRFNNLIKKDTWYRTFSKNSIAVVERKSFEKEVFETEIAQLNMARYTEDKDLALLPGQWTIIQKEDSPSSSTLVKEQIKNNIVPVILDKNVYNYITANNLYAAVTF